MTDSEPFLDPHVHEAIDRCTKDSSGPRPVVDQVSALREEPLRRLNCMAERGPSHRAAAARQALLAGRRRPGAVAAAFM